MSQDNIANKEKPYSEDDYINAKINGYDLDNWNDFCDYYGLDDVVENEEENK
ncbi:hypothetical protein [Enterococcus casseliflavus]|uniref:hypothetical protein n=1 Tax=Enterococcus casseliflavus TaxID=37734 RepID=UPI00325BAC8C